MQLFDLLAVNSSAERLAGMKALFAEGDEEANAAYEEVVELMSMAKASGVPDAQMVFDPTLARGLNYYTGAIFEVWVRCSHRQHLRWWTLCRPHGHLRMGWDEWGRHKLWR